MNLANMTKDDLLRHSAFRLRENQKRRGATMTADHACGCDGHGTSRLTADAAAAVTQSAMATMNAKTDAALAQINAVCRARAGKAVAPSPARTAPGFTADAHITTPGATGPGRYWTPASINTAAAGAWPKRSAA